MVPDRLRRTVPWRLGDLYLLLGLVVVGGVLIGWAAFGADDKATLGDAVSWVNLGVGGLIIVCTGAVLWVLAGMRANSELRRLVLGEIRVRTEQAAHPNHREASQVDISYVTSRGMTRYHRPNCILVAGKVVDVLSAPPPDRRPCDICRSGIADRTASS